MADVSIEEAVTRNCQALVAGNFAQIFADMTPEAMAKLSQLAAAATAAGQPVTIGGPLPRLTGYDIIERHQDGDEHLYHVRFTGDVTFGVKARWRAIGGLWKLADFDAYQGETPP